MNRKFWTRMHSLNSFLSSNGTVNAYRHYFYTSKEFGSDLLLLEPPRGEIEHRG